MKKSTRIVDLLFAIIILNLLIYIRSSLRARIYGYIGTEMLKKFQHDMNIFNVLKFDYRYQFSLLNKWISKPKNLKESSQNPPSSPFAKGGIPRNAGLL